MIIKTGCKSTSYLLVISLTILLAANISMADQNIVHMDQFNEGDLLVDGFILNSQTTISILAIGAQLKESHDMYAYGWILNAETREPVWILSDEDTKRHAHTRYIREYEDDITLPAGKYEVYYYAGRPYYLSDINLKLDDLGEAIKVLGDFFVNDDERVDYYSEEVGELEFSITAPDDSFSKFSPVAEHKKNAIIDFTQADDNYSNSKGFTLKKDMTLKIIAVGELASSNRVFVDYGWIINADNREKVWSMDKWNTSWAGGGRKNRSFVGEVELPAGNYVAHYYTDDSHSFDYWNVMPPYDPLYYGMMISVANEKDLGNVSDFEDNYSEPVVVQITRVRDNQYRYKGFSLKEKTDIHILALGEFGFDDEFADYGWIENIENNEIVWIMEEDNTEYAGGATKNRKFDGIITLPKGDYMVYYVSDDSHAYRSWNASAPFDKDMWGITLYGVGKNFDVKDIKLFDELPENSNLLIGITGVGDNEDIRRSFTMEKSGKVHIFALGEGKDNQMYDYGWIENAESDDVIWEMTYRKTRHAGGDRKNRMVDTHISLEAGKYYVYFTTDGSHSFPDFNASRPPQPQKWGITITLE